jgi:hypothetical protein
VNDLSDFWPAHRPSILFGYVYGTDRVLWIQSRLKEKLSDDEGRVAALERA